MANPTSLAAISLTPHPPALVAAEVSVDAGYHRPGAPGYVRLVASLFAASVATFASLYSTQPLIGDLARGFGVRDSQAALSVSAATLLLGFGMLLASPLSERMGRTGIIKASLAATALLGAASAVAPSWPCLLAIRAAQGLALAGTPAVALVYLREEVAASVHARVTGLYIAGTAIGGMTGRLLSGGIADLAGWRYALGAIALLCIGCALTVVVALPPARHGPQRSSFRRHDSSHRWLRMPECRTAPLRGAERRHAHRVPPLRAAERRHGRPAALRALSDPRLLGLYAIGCVSMGAFVAIYNVLGLRLTDSHYGLTGFAASLVFCVYPLGSVASVTAGRLAGRFGRPAVVLAGCLLAVGGIAITLCSPLVLVITGAAVMTMGFFTAHGVASGWTTAAGQQAGVASEASAFYFLAYYLGSSFFGVVGTSLWSAHGWPGVAILTGGLYLLGALVATTAARTRRLALATSPDLAPHNA